MDLNLKVPPSAGTLPKSWGKLGAKLRDFEAANNQLTGTVPREFGVLSGLEIVVLANNSGLTGCLPAQWKAQVRLACGAVLPHSVHAA